MRGNVLNSIHDCREVVLFVGGEDEMDMIRHDDSAMQPIRNAMIPDADLERQVALSEVQDLSRARAKSNEVRFPVFLEVR
jgi:hypothetical protein